jgi:glutaredoxin
MNLKIYSVSDCKYCSVLMDTLSAHGIQYEIVKVLKADELPVDGDEMPFAEWISNGPDVPIIQKCMFPQVYIDGEYIGGMKDTIRHLYGAVQNETK